MSRSSQASASLGADHEGSSASGLISSREGSFSSGELQRRDSSHTLPRCLWHPVEDVPLDAVLQRLRISSPGFVIRLLCPSGTFGSQLAQLGACFSVLCCL